MVALAVAVLDAVPVEDEAESVSVVELEAPAEVVAFSTELIVSSALSGTVDVSDIVTETGGAVVTSIPSGGCSEPSTSSGLKMVMPPLQLDASWLS